MTVPQEIIWELDDHTRAKHEILRRYLGAWFGIIGDRAPNIVYIDGFCGPGRYENGEIGSPIIALREAIKHSDRLSNNQVIFIFVDEDPERIAHLRRELQGFPHRENFSIHTIAGQFERELSKLLDDLTAEGARLAPTFALVDPFGFKGIPFNLVRRLLTEQSTEVFVNVMVDSLNRWLTHPDAKIRQHIVELFGTEEVLTIAQGSGNRVAALRALYQKQLSECARFVRYFEMRNRRDRVIYYLFFAGNHPLGHVKMKEAFWKVDSASGFRFSDATNPHQLVMFETDETSKLAADLLAKFVGQRIPVERVLEYVENQTAFIAKQMREALKRLENEGQLVVEELKLNGKKRRRGTFPRDAVVQF